MDNLERIDERFDRINNIATSIVDETSLRLQRLVRRHKTYVRFQYNQDPFELYDWNNFKSRFRFTKHTVEAVILPLIELDLQSTVEDNRGLPITARTKLLIALRFYATGSFQTVCGDIISVSQPTVCRIIAKVSAVLATLLPQFIKFPNSEQILRVKEQFQELGRSHNMHGLNDIIAAINCSHIKINRPRNISHSEVYRNRKGIFSVNTQAIVGPNMEIYDIVARWPGSSHDSRISRNSSIYMRCIRREIRGIMVGDSGYPSLPFLITPVIQPTTRAEKNYNFAHIRTRNVVERFFGVWKKKFPCLQLGLRTKLRTSVNVIIACAVLHNIGIQNGDIYEEDYEVLGIGDIRSHIPSSSEGLAMRQTIIAQFI